MTTLYRKRHEPWGLDQLPSNTLLGLETSVENIVNHDYGDNSGGKLEYIEMRIYNITKLIIAVLENMDKEKRNKILATFDVYPIETSEVLK